MKQPIAAILASCLAMTLPVYGETLIFTDVPVDSWQGEFIYPVVEEGLLVGRGNQTFAPLDTMTRADFLVPLLKYFFPEVTEEYTSNASSEIAWFAAYFAAAEAVGLLEEGEFQGYEAENHQFFQTLPCTREEMAYLIVKSIEIRGDNIPLSHYTLDDIPDAEDITEKYRDQVRVAYGLGLLAGKDSVGTFAPDASVTREAGAVVIYRLITLETDTE